MKPRFLTLLFLFWILFWVSILWAAAPPVPEQPANYVVDLAGIIDPQSEADLNRRLKELEDKTTAQMVVLTIESLEGEPIEKLSLRTAEKWALGQKGKDNGVLITVAVKDRKYRIEVGYGLEAILPDSLVGSMGRECFVANFRRGKYSVGISEVVRKITGQIIGNEVEKIIKPKKPKLTESIQIKEKATGESTFILIVDWFFYLLFYIVGILLLIVGLFSLYGGGVGAVPYHVDTVKKKGIWWWLLYGVPDNSYNGSYGFGSSAGGGFGGGGGGFGGGGGGGFGGGGVSGGW